jgi:hypothetical protein
MASNGWVQRFKSHAYFLSVKVSGWVAAAANCIIEVDYMAQPSFNMDITGLF